MCYYIESWNWWGVTYTFNDDVCLIVICSKKKKWVQART